MSDNNWSLDQKIKKSGSDKGGIKVGHKSWYKKWWVIILLSVAALLIIWVITSVILAYYYVKSGKVNQLYTTTDELQNNQSNGTLPDELLYTQDDPSLGDSSAPIKIAAFIDFQCSYCQEVYQVMPSLVDKYPEKIYVVMRDFPIDQIHPQARLAAMAAECAHEQDRYWEFHDQVFANQDRLAVENILSYGREVGLDMKQFADCITSEKYSLEVEEDYQTGIKAGIKGTPAYIINGELFEGAIPIESWEQALDNYQE